MNRKTHSQYVVSINAMQTKLKQEQWGRPKSLYVGPGAARAKERLKAKLKANEAIPSHATKSRQQLRQDARAEMKRLRVTAAGVARVRMEQVKKGLLRINGDRLVGA